MVSEVTSGLNRSYISTSRCFTTLAGRLRRTSSFSAVTFKGLNSTRFVALSFAKRWRQGDRDHVMVWAAAAGVRVAVCDVPSLFACRTACLSGRRWLLTAADPAGVFETGENSALSRVA